MNNFREKLNTAGFEYVSVDVFVEMANDIDLLKSITTHRRFSESLVGETLGLTSVEKEDSGIYRFGLVIESNLSHMFVTQWQMIATKSAKGAGNILQDSKTAEGPIVSWKFTKFIEDRTDAGHLILPRGMYNMEVLANHFKQDPNDVRKLMTADWKTLDDQQRDLRNDIMRWAQHQEFKQVIRSKYLTDKGNLTKEAKNMRYGVLEYTAVDRLS